MTRAVLFLTLISGCSLCAAIPSGERTMIHQELQEPARITLTNGRTIFGYSIEVDGDVVRVGTSKGAGEAIYTFHPDAFDRFLIPGESYKSLALEWLEAGETENALELMAMLFQQRSQMLPLLPPTESHFFIHYVQLILESPKPARAIGVASVLKPQIENPAALRVLEDAVLQSYNTLELHKEARHLAEEWVASRDPHGDSALGYYVLGAALLREAAYEDALDIALQPVVFAGPVAREHLAHCYAIAISAAFGLRDRDYAHRLYEELKQRNLAWPIEDPVFDSAYRKLHPDSTDL